MSKEKKMIPELRFPEFLEKGGWVIKEVGEIFQVTRGYVLPMTLVKEVPTKEYPYPVFSSQTKNNGLAGYYNEYLYEDAITWTTDGANAGDVNYRDGKFYCTNVCGVLMNEEGFANACIAELINSVSKKHVSYVGNPKLMNGVMSKIQIPVPSISEQQKIASCLSSLDELLAAHNDKLDALKDHKKGLLQNLFPQEGETVPKVRFPEFEAEGEWVEKKLGKVAKFLSGGTPSKSNPLYWGGTIPWISAASMHETQVHDSESKITEQAVSAGTRIVNEGTILILVRGSMLFNRVPICITMKAVSFNQDVKALMLNENCTTRFMFYHLLAYESFIPIDKTGIGAGKIGLEELKELTLHIPKSGEEQQKIASCLSAADELITAQQERIEQLQQHKKGLMQGLFPKIER